MIILRRLNACNNFVAGTWPGDIGNIAQPYIEAMTAAVFGMINCWPFTFCFIRGNTLTVNFCLFLYHTHSHTLVQRERDTHTRTHTHTTYTHTHTHTHAHTHTHTHAYTHTCHARERSNMSQSLYTITVPSLLVNKASNDGNYKYEYNHSSSRWNNSC